MSPLSERLVGVPIHTPHCAYGLCGVIRACGAVQPLRGRVYSIGGQQIAVYIARQKEHHRTVSFAEEYRAFLVENGVTIREEFFLKD